MNGPVVPLPTPGEWNPEGWAKSMRAAGIYPPNRSEWIDPDTWRDPDCVECGGEGAPCCEPPDTPPPRWVHCSPDLLASGVDCATAPRRPCSCPHCGSHDHSVPRSEANR